MYMYVAQHIVGVIFGLRFGQKWDLAVSSCLQHETVFDVQHDLLPLAIVSDQGVDGVAVWHPTYQSRVGGQRNH